MINESDVITLKVPFPNINSKLAVKAHMYICQSHIKDNYRFVKCQTMKPYLIGNDAIKDKIIEEPNRSRNPFNHKTVIDCDKVFTTLHVEYSDTIKTANRQNVCKEIMAKITYFIALGHFSCISINESELVSINYSVSFIQNYDDIC